MADRVIQENVFSKIVAQSFVNMSEPSPCAHIPCAPWICRAVRRVPIPSGAKRDCRVADLSSLPFIGPGSLRGRWVDSAMVAGTV